MAILLLPLFALLAVARATVVYYPPVQSNTNNLTFALNGTGAPGIYTSSVTPDKDYGVYNWCAMPHVRPREYKMLPREYTLEYVEVIQRHHKRTPYASNTFFKEDVAWSCVGEGPVFYGKGPSGVSSDVTEIQWQAFRTSQNPWVNTVGPGFVNTTCQLPQITTEGLEDSHVHGSDLRAVYAKRLGLSDRLDASLAQIRVTNNVITSQVAGALVKGLFPATKNTAVLVQSSTYDSLEPTYSCPKADAIRSAYVGGSANWTNHLTAAAALYAKLDAVSGTSNPDTGGWHNSFDHYYDNLSAKLCHGKKLPCSVNDTSLCVTRDEANTVFRLGNWEYSYYFRDAPNSAQYAALHYGAWFLELKSHLQAVQAGQSKTKYFHNVAHDGSVSSVLGFLQIAKMVWPGMGSEVVFELYSKKNKSFFVRVLWGGQPMQTSTPLGTLDLVPVETFFQYIDSMTGSGEELLAACRS
ncbi:Histidine phosphatase [Mycena indigotica]|uniref:Histidine phosphatase n=1 Tax=Mycena indigotica TaxID=2126181 RepID=A0A8H6S8A3_9AGAR|nr:Histidine phosphatase [Mycena indigotica]KAF7294756.1 Histidine phosphatase [Mycena indigotica]